MRAALALQKTLYSRLATDPLLTSLIGPGKVFDWLPPGTAPPFVLFSGAETSPGLASGDPSEEITLDLEIWSDAAGRREAAILTDAVRTAVERPIALDPPMILANLEWIRASIAMRFAGRHCRALLRLRAVIETMQ